ncbi:MULTISPECIES: hypothetical protein [Arcobacteraceae]|uniref:hypothetical protein n=1 Tax=Arcobacteraceae TaxID=2808963 RepID=UPI000DEB1514|nr:hypothetical protein [Arcobacter sp. CECT 9188]RBQ27766.1 hypothetical protein CRU88_03595 [Arcobacter sp. CECT 9188]
MKYIKYFLAYLSLITIIGLFVFSFYTVFKDDFGLSLIERDIIMSATIPLFYLYIEWRPFKLTGNLDLYLKEKWDNYLDSQKTCLNCNKVVKSSEIKNGICKSCRDLDNKNSKFGYKRKERNER